MGESPKNRALRAADSLKSESYDIHRLAREYGWYLLVGTFNAIVFWGLYELLYWLDPLQFYPAVVAWAISFALSSVQAHYLHRRITFRSDADYVESLRWALAVYGIFLVLSTISEFFLVYIADVNHRVAWAVNMCAFGFANFLGLRLLAFPPELDGKE
jgi:putative flippase GtrA